MSTLLKEAPKTEVRIVEEWTPFLGEFLHLPQNRTEYDNLCEISYRLSFPKKKIAIKKKKAVESILQIIDLFIEQYDKEHCKLKHADPVDTLKYLMESNNLVQTDLIKETGSQGMVSKILNRKRKISISIAKKLGERFNTSMEVFLK